MGLFKKQQQTAGLCRLDYCNNSERSSRKFIKTNEAPYQTVGKITLSATLGYKELFYGHFWLSLLSECLSCYLYVFIVCSTRISWTGAIIGHEPNLLAMALSSGIAMMLLIFTFRTVHVNPALTISFLLTGRIPLIRALLYVLVHCISSVAAIAFLYSISIKGHSGALGLDSPHDVLSSWQVLIVEIVISFVVTLATYATCNYSSYTCAKKFILEQLGQTASLFPPSLCDNATGYRQSSRRTVAPLVPQVPPTSITLLDSGREAICEVASGYNDQESNKPYLISSHYNQVYDDYNDVVMNSRVMDRVENSSDHTKNNNFRAPLTNEDFDKRRFDNQTMKNTSNIPNQLSNSNNPLTKSFIPNSYQEDNYDYEYDNHRLYSNHQLRSETSSETPIEEIMQDECQLLAPNGFSLHVTSGQAFAIGLAYTLASLSGIPASGASLNPARSFGPAFIMNLWEHHWIYWLGPILGAVIAGFFYEFIFNPTRKSSLCYRPKLFRFSAHDMAKFGSKSRLYQHQQQKLSTTMQPSATIYRPQIHKQIHSSPSGRLLGANTTNRIGKQPGLLNSSRDPTQLIVASTSASHLQPSYSLGANGAFEQINYTQQHLYPQPSNLDNRTKSAATMINLKQPIEQHQNNLMLPPRNQNNADMVLNIDHVRPQQDNTEQAVYDNPKVQAPQFRTPNLLTNRRILLPSNVQHKFEIAPTVSSHSNLPGLVHSRVNDINSNGLKQFNTVHPNVRPHSLALEQLNLQRQVSAHLDNNRHHAHDLGQLDDELYNVLTESHDQQLNGQFQSNDLDYANNLNASTSDSSQRTNEMIAYGSSSDRSQHNTNLSMSNSKDYDDYYN